MRFRDMSPDDQDRHLEITDGFLALCQTWRGDPRLTAWEEGFLTGLARQIRDTNGMCPISEKQILSLSRVIHAMEQRSVDVGTEAD